MVLDALLKKQQAPPRPEAEPASHRPAEAAPRERLAAAVRRARERRQMSQRQLAEAVGVSQSLISLIETPSRPLNVNRDRLLDILRNGLGLGYREIDALLWLAGKARLSADEVRLLFGPTVVPEQRSPADLAAITRSLLAPDRPGPVAAARGALRRFATGLAASPRRLAAGATALLAAGAALGWGIAVLTSAAPGARLPASAADYPEVWGWISVSQAGRPGAQTFDVAAQRLTPLFADGGDLAAVSMCPTDRSLVAVVERTGAGLAVALKDPATPVVRWTASQPAASPADLSWIEGCSRLVYRAADQRLLAVRVDGGGEEVIARLEPGTSAAAVAPNRRAIAWIGGDGLLRVRREAGPAQVLGRAEAAAPTWAADSERLAWLGPEEGGRRPLQLAMLRTGQQRTLARVDRTAHLLSWSASGTGLAFAVREDDLRDRIFIWAFSLRESIPVFTIAGPPITSLTWSCGHEPHGQEREALE